MDSSPAEGNLFEFAWMVRPLKPSSGQDPCATGTFSLPAQRPSQPGDVHSLDAPSGARNCTTICDAQLVASQDKQSKP
jgi:hypothetical protein